MDFLKASRTELHTLSDALSQYVANAGDEDDNTPDQMMKLGYAEAMLDRVNDALVVIIA